MQRSEYLAGLTIYPTLAHEDKIISLYATAVDEVFAEIAKAIARGGISRTGRSYRI